MKNTIYFLKRKHGKYAVLFRVTGASLNLETGLQTITKTSTVIKRVIFLPTNVTRQIITRSNFYFDPDKRLVLIDRRDIDFEITVNDFIIYKYEKYNVVEVNNYDVDGAFSLIVQSDGRMKHLFAEDVITVTSTAGFTI